MPIKQDLERIQKRLEAGSGTPFCPPLTLGEIIELLFGPKKEYKMQEITLQTVSGKWEPKNGKLKVKDQEIIKKGISVVHKFQEAQRNEDYNKP